MASIERRGETYHVDFRFAGQRFKASLKTDDEDTAANRKREVEETLRLLRDGRISLPPNPDREATLQFILSGGRTVAKPVVVVDDSPTLVAMLDDYFAAMANGKADETVEGERIHAKHFRRLLGDDTRFRDVDADALRAYAEARQGERGQRGKTVSAQTVAKEFRTWSQVWNFARKRGVVQGTSPHKDVRLDRPEQALPFMTWDEIEAVIKRGNVPEDEQGKYWDCLFLDETQVVELVAHVEANALPFLHAAVAMAAFTGARRAEIIRSQVEDWDFERGIVRIRGKKPTRKLKLEFRDVPIHPRLQRIMQAWFAQHPGGTFTIMAPADAPRSKSKNGEPTAMSRDQAHYCLQDALAGSKWKVVKGWHTLRHSFCSNCARREVPDLILDRWMGHKGDEAVKQRYRHLFPQDQREFMGRLWQ